MHFRPPRRRKPRGTSLVEAMIAMSVLLFGLTGVASLQLATSKANQFSRRYAQASAVATDLEENINLWSYSDSRLNTANGVTSLSDPSIVNRWDMGSSATASFVADYSDKTPDSNASSAGALGAAYPGLSGDIDGDGVPEFTRYWNVSTVDLMSSGVPNGKLVQIIVRWYEPGTGYKQLNASTFKPNPAYAIH